MKFPERKEKIHILSDGDDWIGFYINGKLIDEGHGIDIEDVLKVLGFNVSRSVEEDSEFWERYDFRCPPTYPGKRKRA